MVTELNGERDREQINSELFDQSLVSLSHQRKKRTTVEDNVSEDGNLNFMSKYLIPSLGRDNQDKIVAQE